MFSFGSKNKRQALAKCMRRLADITTPNIQPIEEDSRLARRNTRVLPALLVPWQEGGPQASEVQTVLLKDISDLGAGLVLDERCEAREVLIAVWVCEEESPWFFMGQVRQQHPIGGGHWALGLELTEVIDITDLNGIELLAPYVARLLPT